MNVNVKNLLESWKQLIISCVIFVIFGLLASWLKATYFTAVMNENWATGFFQHMMYAIYAAALLTVISILCFSFLGTAVSKTLWWVFMILNILASAVSIALFLYLYQTPEQDIWALVIAGIMFFFMYVFSYIVSTLFLPSTYKLANPLVKTLFM